MSKDDMNALKIGDLDIVDDEHLGFAVYKDGKRLVWFNKEGQEELCKWIVQKGMNESEQAKRVVRDCDENVEKRCERCKKIFLARTDKIRFCSRRCAAMKVWIEDDDFEKMVKGESMAAVGRKLGIGRMAVKKRLVVIQRRKKLENRRRERCSRIAKENMDILNVRVEELELSVKALLSLQALEVSTLGELKGWKVSSLLNTRRMSRKVIGELGDVLFEFGLRFAEEERVSK